MNFSFKNHKKSFMNVEMMDGTKLTLPAPKLGVMRKLASDEIVNATDYSKIIPFITQILNTNLQKRKFKDEQIANNWDTHDLISFFTAYTNFVQDINEEKN